MSDLNAARTAVCRNVLQGNDETLQQLLPRYETATVCADPETYPTPVLTRRRYARPLYTLQLLNPLKPTVAIWVQL